MSLILKQEPANTIATPPAGKSTLFINDSSVMSVKTPAGTVTTFPTVQGSNTQVFFNDDTAINGSANLTFTKTTNTLTLTNGNVVATGIKTDNFYYANGSPWDLGGNPGGANTQVQFNNDGEFGGSANLTFDGNNFSVTGNTYISGNLTVDGNVVYVNVESLSVEDPLIALGGGPNGNALVSNNGYDRGLILHNYTTQAVDAFMGWDTSNAEFSLASNASVSGEVVTINTLGNVRANIGKLGGLLIGSQATQADFPNAKAIISQDNSGQTHSENIGVVGEAVADSGNTSTWGIGVLGEAVANGATKATGVQGGGYVTNSADTGAAVGVRGYSIQTHSGGYNIGVLGNASGSGLGSYAFYVQAGNIGSIETATGWDLVDNSTAALTFQSTGKANIFGIETTDGAEGIYTQGYLNVTGNASVGGVKTDNYYYANGSPLDFQQPSGSNTEIQFNDANNFGGSAAFTFNKTSNTVQIGGILSVVGNANIGNIGTGGLLTATGNIGGGNINTGGVVSATGNVTGGNLTTGGVVTATGNVTGGNLKTGGIVSATGNGTFGNISTGVASVVDLSVSGNVTGPLLPNANITYDLGSPTQRWKDLYLANTTIYLGNATITANGNAITTSGNTTAANLSTGGILSVGGNANVGNLGTGGLITATGNIGGGNINTGGLITATGNLNAGNVITGGIVSATGNGTFGNVTATTFTGAFNGSATSATTAGTVTTNAQPNITSVGVLTSVSVSGNVNSSIMVNGGTGIYLSPGPSGYINFFTTGGDKASISDTGNITASNVVANSTIFATTANISGNVNAGNVYANSGTIGASLLTGTLTTAAQPNITSTGTLASLSVTGTATAGNLATAGTLSVGGNANVGNLGTTALVATGAGSFGANVNMNGNWLTNIGYAVANTDAASKAYVDTMISSGIAYHQPVNVATTTTLAVATGGTTAYNSPNGAANGIGAYISTTGTFLNIDSANVQTVGTRILVKDEANATWNGIYTYANTTAIVRSNDTDEYGPDSAAQLSINDYFFTLGGVVNEGTAFIVSAPSGTITFGTSNITFSVFSTSQVYDAGTGINITGTTISANASQTQITAVGTLTSLSVSGNANIGNIGTGGLITATGNLNAGNIITGGIVSATGNGTFGNVTATTFTGALSGAATTAGTVTTAAQPNITSTGTLASLSVSGNANVGNIGAVAGVFTGNVSIGNIVSSGTGGNISGANVISANILISNIANGTAPFTVTSTTQVANLSVATSGTATTAGTVTTAAQPNITSVGTLTSLGVSGAVTASTLVSNVAIGTAPLTVTSTTRVGNLNVDYANVADNINVVAGTGNNFLIFANAATGNVAELTSTGLIANLSNNSITATTFVGALSGAATSATSATTAGTVTTNAQPNITSVGTLSALSVTATITGSVSGTAATITTAAQPNITSVGTLTGLSFANASTLTGNNFTLSTGANTNAGTITGTWTLSAGSKLNATYADLAEKYVADADYQPGTVLVFGGEQEVTLSTESDSYRVAGVVTTNPAYTMNNGCEGEHVATIALQGRVPVKIIGPVFKGDLLVSCGNGHAIANNIARAGTIIGKSLENFSEATGVIEVAVGRF
jgi:hypothetical protein